VEVDATESALGDERSDRFAVGWAAMQVVRKDDLDIGLRGAANGDPAEAFTGDVVAYFEAERGAVEAQRDIGIMDLYEATASVRFIPARLGSERPARGSDPPWHRGPAG
jgi:hypothetical protein